MGERGVRPQKCLDHPVMTSPTLSRGMTVLIFTHTLYGILKLKSKRETERDEQQNVRPVTAERADRTLVIHLDFSALCCSRPWRKCLSVRHLRTNVISVHVYAH